MNEAASRRLKVNKVLAGHSCAACGQTLALGEDCAQCTACETIHHSACWDRDGGCANQSCINRPLAKLEDSGPAVVAQAPPGQRVCPFCGAFVSMAEEICLYCDNVISADGVYHGPKENAPGAVASLVWGLVGLVICGPILGGIAIAKSSEAKRNIAANPRYGGSGYATAGFVLGIVDIVFFIIGLLVRFSDI